jgi:hypothetical protein
MPVKAVKKTLLFRSRPAGKSDENIRWENPQKSPCQGLKIMLEYLGLW